MKPEDTLPSLDKLGGDIERLRAKSAPPQRVERPRVSGGAMRLGTELVSGVVVGVAAGYELDKWFNTSPWLLIVCFLLGTAGGGLNMYRTMKVMDKEDGATGGPADSEKET